MKITYTTTDGKTFTDKKQAEAHEASLSDPKSLLDRLTELEKRIERLETAAKPAVWNPDPMFGKTFAEIIEQAKKGYHF